MEGICSSKGALKGDNDALVLKFVTSCGLKVFSALALAAIK
jgi:hypothetical protein